MQDSNQKSTPPTTTTITPPSQNDGVVVGRRNNSLLLILSSGFALLSDGYQNSLMTMTNLIFHIRYGTHIYTPAISTRISNASLVGAIIGQIVVGVICDRIGRKSGITFTTTLLVVGAVFATAAFPVAGKPDALFWWLTVARGCVGIGVGGEYPASSTSASEAANERFDATHRSQVFILVTNLVLSFGTILSLSLFLILIKITGYNNQSDSSAFNDLAIIWRVVFGMGAIFPLVIFYFRIKLINSTLYRNTAMRKQVPYKLALKRYWKRLIGTAGVWFIYDFVVFPLGIFSSTIISALTPHPTLLKVAQYQLLLSSLGLPGVFIGILLLPRLGSRYTFIFGLSGFLVLGLVIGVCYERLDVAVLVVLYGMIVGFGNAGPGNLCGLVSSAVYPSGLRGSFYGVSAAFGKVGAAVGVQVFTPIQQHLGKRWVFIISAILGLFGIGLVYFLVPETTNLDLAREDTEWLEYLVENGWEGELGDGTQRVVGVKEALERVRDAECVVGEAEKR